MSGGPLLRFLGLPPDADDRAVLALDARAAGVPAAIDAARRARVEQVRRHPGGTGPDAEMVVARIALAASRLRGQAVGRPAPAARGDASPPAASPPNGSAGSPRAGRPAAAADAAPAPMPPSTSAPSPAPPAADRPGRARPPAPATSAATRRGVPASIAARQAAAPSGDRGAFRPEDLPALTPFDHAALGALVGHGGWNRRSRARLVTLAASHGVSPQGLVNVVSGLAAYARAGGRPGDVAAMASSVEALTRPASEAAGSGTATRGDVDLMAEIDALDAPPITAVPDSDGPWPIGRPQPPTAGEKAARAADDAADLARRLLPELQAPSPWEYVKLTAMVLLPVILLILLFAEAFSSPGRGAERGAAAGQGAASPPAGAAAGGDDRPRLTDAGPAGAFPAADRAPRGGPLVFARIPVLAGPPASAELLGRADDFAALPEVIETEVTRRLQLQAAVGDATIYRWAAAMADAGAGWTRSQVSDVRAVRTAAVGALLTAGDRPELLERFAAELRPPGLPTGTTAGGVPSAWAGAWRVSVLGAAIVDPFAPADVPRVAREILASVVTPANDDRLVARLPLPAEAGARPAAYAWLAAAAGRLVEEGAAAADWERWLDALDAVAASTTDRSGRDAVIGIAIERVLRSDTDLQIAPGAELLGRLVAEFSEPAAPMVRDLAVAATADPAVATVADARALASILALRRDLPWFRDRFVLPDAATPATRARFASFIEEAWPDLARRVAAGAGRPLPVDPQTLLIWRDLRIAVDDLPDPPDTIGALHQAWLFGLLSEAGHLLAAGRIDEAAAALDTAGEGLGRSRRVPDGTPAMRPADGSLFPAGAWAHSWASTRGRGDDAVARVRALRTEAGFDLHPVDARVFAEVVAGGSNRRARDVAHSVLLEKFRGGTNVALALLDAIEAVRVDAALLDVVGAYTGRTIVGSSPDARYAAMRLALLEHATALLEDEDDEVVALSRRIGETLVRRAAALRGEREIDLAERDPDVVARSLSDAWMRAASVRVALRPVPAPVDEIESRRRVRRRVAGDAMQASVAELVTALDAAGFVAASEQPDQADRIVELLRSASASRRTARTAAVQWLETERALLDVWSVRFGLAGQPDPGAGS